MDIYHSATDMLHVYAPDIPVVGLRPHAAKRAALWFLNTFPGKVLYAVKANSRKIILDTLYNAGIRCFDIASHAELELISTYPKADIYAMNPIKSRRFIAQAYYDYGVRNFALDCEAELEKILSETGNAKDLNLFVRLTCDTKGAHICLDRKFGISPHTASNLLSAVRRVSERLGLTFHVGSQAMQPSAYRKALHMVNALITQSGVLPDIIDIGGGFPSLYANMTPPPMDTYISEISHAFEQMNVVETCELLCEPGRALVAEAVSAVVKVDLRKENALYINDGAYGLLYDAAHYNFIFPTRLRSNRKGQLGVLAPFVFFGPTCDSADFMPGPFSLPNCIQEGDYIEIGQLGAYAEVFRTSFNGYGQYDVVQFEDDPMVSLYQSEQNLNQDQNTYTVPSVY